MARVIHNTTSLSLHVYYGQNFNTSNTKISPSYFETTHLCSNMLNLRNHQLPRNMEQNTSPFITMHYRKHKPSLNSAISKHSRNMYYLDHSSYGFIRINVDDFKPLTKRPKITKGIKVFPEQMPARVLRMAQTYTILSHLRTGRR